jgi:hypothetical protein
MEDKILQFILGTVVGGLITGLINARFDKKKNKYTTKHKFKEERYKAITLLMYSLINYDKEQTKLFKLRPDLNSKEDLVAELKNEWTNMALYANDTVFLKTKYFLETPNQESFNKALLAIRSNLYDINTKLIPEDLNLNTQQASTVTKNHNLSNA